LLFGLDPHDDLRKHVMPADDIHPAPLRNVELALQLRPEALTPTSAEIQYSTCVAVVAL
jgi:hypothetical protein